MSHRSRGCLRCRQRRVKCDKGRPACQRCISRSEPCIGYRDEMDLMFLDQTDKVVQKVESNFIEGHKSSSRTACARSKSLERSNIRLTARQVPNAEPSYLPWLKTLGVDHDRAYTEDNTVSEFLQNYVIYPTTECPGFLEHLPSLFKEVNVTGRYALRWAVQAAAFADLSRSKQNREAAIKSLEFYSLSLQALKKSLSPGGKSPDDYDLMTVVILDIFESLFLPDEPAHGYHAQAMAHILRLRGHEQLHDPRGWGLFRLAHHRIQKERLAKRISPLVESQKWLDGLNADMAFVQLEGGSLKVSQVCDRARSIIQELASSTSPSNGIVDLIREMHGIDHEISQWRQRPEWSFRVISRDDLAVQAGDIAHLPCRIEVHRDIWMAYEWNYHRTARIILHQQLLECLSKLPARFLQQPSGADELDIYKWVIKSITLIHHLADEILSTVPQSLGDIDRLGQYVRSPTGQSRLPAIGAYFLLWPIKIVKSPSGMTTQSQKQSAQAVFERIREFTGMKSHLGAMSSI